MITYVHCCHLGYGRTDVSFKHDGQPAKWRDFTKISQTSEWRLVRVVTRLTCDPSTNWKVLPWADGWTLVRTSTRRGRR